MKCPRCGTLLVKRGLRQTMRGNKQLYFCNACKKKITPEWPRMRFSRADVMHAVKLYSGGKSLAYVKKDLESRGVRVSRWAILKWHRKFG